MSILSYLRTDLAVVDVDVMANESLCNDVATVDSDRVVADQKLATCTTYVIESFPFLYHHIGFAHPAASQRLVRWP